MWLACSMKIYLEMEGILVTSLHISRRDVDVIVASLVICCIGRSIYLLYTMFLH
jgi:hypothetical protein